jgi:hypothetical protein
MQRFCPHAKLRRTSPREPYHSGNTNIRGSSRKLGKSTPVEVVIRIPTFRVGVKGLQVSGVTVVLWFRKDSEEPFRALTVKDVNCRSRGI